MKLVNSIPAEERNPTIFKLNLSTSKIMFDDNTFLKMPSLVLFREGKTEEGKSAVREFRKAFPAVRDRVLGFLSGNSKPIELKLLSTMGLGAKETLPFIALLTFDFNQEGRAIFTTYRFRGEIRQHLVEEFVDQYTAGVLQPEGLLSEPVPEGPDALYGAVHKLVGKTYHEFLQRDTVDKVVFYSTTAQKCAPCENFMPILQNFADMIGHVETLQVATIDTGLNSAHLPRRFPTVVMFPAGKDKVEPGVTFNNNVTLGAIEYMGNIVPNARAEFQLIRWAYDSATNKFDVNGLKGLKDEL